MLRPEEDYELPGSEVIRMNRKSALVRLDDGSEVWVPLSVVVGDDLEVGSTDVTVLAWWAEQEGVL